MQIEVGSKRYGPNTPSFFPNPPPFYPPSFSGMMGAVVLVFDVTQATGLFPSNTIQLIVTLGGYAELFGVTGSYNSSLVFIGQGYFPGSFVYSYGFAGDIEGVHVNCALNPASISGSPSFGYQIALAFPDYGDLANGSILFQNGQLPTPDSTTPPRYSSPTINNFPVGSGVKTVYQYNSFTGIPPAPDNTYVGWSQDISGNIFNPTQPVIKLLEVTPIFGLEPFVPPNT